ncbi:unnamed protein product [Boreogadus saida]
MSLMITKENLENANVGSDEPKLFPDHVTTQEYLDNATVVSDKPKLFPDHVTTQEYLDNATVVSDKPKLFPDHVTTQEYLDNATVVSDKPKLFPDHVTTQTNPSCSLIMLLLRRYRLCELQKDEIGKKERNIRRRSHTSHNIRHKEKHAVKKERYKTCHQKTMDARGVCSN